MALKVYCNICGKFIRDLSKAESGTATGDEICMGCQAKIKLGMKRIEEGERQFHDELEKQFREAKKAFDTFMAVNKGKHAQVNIILGEIKANISDSIREATQGKSKKKKESNEK